MSTTALLFTDRPNFDPVWRPPLQDIGFEVRTLLPDDLPATVDAKMGVVIDAASSAYDEDEVLAHAGLARALGASVLVHLPRDGSMGGIDEVVDEICGALVVRRENDVPRASSLLARCLDADRSTRFEYVTVAPRDGSLLAILGDGRSQLSRRPVTADDDETSVVSIALSDDASTATLELSSGCSVTLRAAHMAQALPSTVENGGPGTIDGAKLGAKLRKLRLSAGLTQAELARRTGIHRPNIARVEAGRHTPSLETLTRLANAIGVPTTSVLSAE